MPSSNSSRETSDRERDGETGKLTGRRMGNRLADGARRGQTVII